VVKSITIPKKGDEMLSIVNDPYEKFTPGGKSKPVSKNPLIYSGDNVNYIDP